MPTDTDLERRLRDALRDQAGSDWLPEHVVLDSLSLGRTTLRRRRLTVAAAVASAAVVAGLALAAVRPDAHDVQPAPPGPTPTTGTDSSAIANAWADSLPEGGADAPYLNGTTLVQPDGGQIQVPGSKAEIVGLSVAGPVLLVGTVGPDPSTISWQYVLVRPSGELRDLPLTIDTCCGSEDGLLSPDGVLFTRGEEILDMRDLSTVGEIPGEARMLLAWTSHGIVYLAADGHFKLWSPGHPPLVLASNPGVFARGGDVAVDMCGTIKRLTADGALEPVAPDCVHGAWSLAPSGRWVLTDDLSLVEVATGARRSLTDTTVLATDRRAKVWWDGDAAVTFPAGDYLVRCATDTATCQRVAGPEQELGLP